MDKDYYDYKDIARLLSVSERSARIIMVQPEFPSFKLGSKVRVFIKDYDQWFKGLVGKDIPLDPNVNKFKKQTSKEK